MFEIFGMQIWQIMDLFAEEWFTDWFSILFGYLAFCVTWVTLIFPLSITINLFWRQIGKALIAHRIGTVLIFAVTSLSMVIWALTSIWMHDLLNLYQVWYTQPMAPGLSL